MLAFDFHLPTRILFGPDEIDSLGDRAAELGCRRALVVSDAGIVAAGHVGRGIASLEKAGLATELFSEIHENPTTADVDRGVEVARRFAPDLIVGLGGGSSMDCAKGINFIHTGGGRMQDYWGVGKATAPMLPMMAVPTTAGTGSEAQSFALISDAETHAKMACGDKKAAFRVAILDPKLTLTQPARVTALTGIDAIAHALETYVTRVRNSISLSFSRESWRLLAGNYLKVLAEPRNLEARGAMQLGACLAGLAIENSMLGAAHATANPLTARYGIVHGQAVAVMLPHVIRYNGAAYGKAYAELIDAISGHVSADLPRNVESLARFVTRLIEQAGLKIRLSELGVSREHFADLATGAAKQWTARFNPRGAGLAEFVRLYEAAWE